MLNIVSITKATLSVSTAFVLLVICGKRKATKHVEVKSQKTKTSEEQPTRLQTKITSNYYYPETMESGSDTELMRCENQDRAGVPSERPRCFLPKSKAEMRALKAIAEGYAMFARHLVYKTFIIISPINRTTCNDASVESNNHEKSRSQYPKPNKTMSRSSKST
ncbi:unnamed protein product [Thelazia callipaeda]|uniref:Secreted protein n=1 Tax=Thelazia callipaeda TaxID=103827 RepID=A0A0N5CMC9_THECL|nr:unnamed protein product [Thelazia callipaeda]